MSKPPSTGGSKISNPYAKKKSNSSSSSSSNSTNQRLVVVPGCKSVGATTSQVSPPNRGAAIDKTTAFSFPTSSSLSTRDAANFGTFSQAFASIEDTTHYRSEVVVTTTTTTTTNQQQHLVRLEQLDFDTQAARDEALRLEARDAHALLQPHVLYVSTKQRGNGILKYIRNVPHSFSKMVPDYIMSSQRCALFLSIKYHNLHPTYIQRRIAELKSDFTVRILLVLVDVEDNANVLLSLNKIAVTHELTLLLAWSEEEAARYLETFKALDGKDASTIQKREQTNFVDQVADVLSTVRSVNKTDAAQLLSQFESIKQLVAASEDELTLCPGLGEKKVKRLWEALHKPFSSRNAKKRKEDAEKRQAEEQNEFVDNGKNALGSETKNDEQIQHDDDDNDVENHTEAAKHAVDTVGK